MKKNRLLVGAILTTLMTLSIGVFSYAANKIKLYEGDIPVMTQNDPIIINDRVFVPLRDAFNTIGASNIKWNEAEQSITAEKEKKIVIMKIGEKKYTVITPEGTFEYSMDAAPVIISSYTYVPARYAAESFGYDIEWDAVNKIVRILGDFSHKGFDENTPYAMGYSNPAWIENGYCNFYVNFVNIDGEVVTPDGYLFIDVFNEDSVQLFHKVERFVGKYYNDDELKKLQYHIALSELPPTLKSNGFIVLRVDTDSGIVFNIQIPVEGLPTKW